MKKLNLKKEVITFLENESMKEIEGGTNPMSDYPCNSGEPNCPTVDCYTRAHTYCDDCRPSDMCSRLIC